MMQIEAIEIGKILFNFHPDEPFTSVEQVLYKARQNKYYELGAARYAEELARLIDNVH